MKQNFIGFADINKFLAAVDRSRPINLTVTRRHGRPDKRHGIAIDSTVLTLSQVQGTEVLYFEHVTHRYQVMQGELFGLDKEKPVRLAEQVQKAVEQYLTDQGVTWRDAMVAMPTNYTTLDGEATFLKYNEEGGYTYLPTVEGTNETV